MTRISDKFQQLQTEGRKGFIPYITAGDPDLATTERLILALAEAGADVIELGVPFSDPMADGPVIQRASERALLNPVGVAEVLPVMPAYKLASKQAHPTGPPRSDGRRRTCVSPMERTARHLSSATAGMTTAMATSIATWC